MTFWPGFPRAHVTAAVLGCVLLAVSCKAADDRSSTGNAEQRPAADLMNEVARARYTPPADGLLTQSQVQMYLAVKERGIELRRARARDRSAAAGAGPSGSSPAGSGASGAPGAPGGHPAIPGGSSAGAADPASDLAIADLRAAEELGQNPKEFSWVREKVLEAQSVAATRALLLKMSSGRDQLIARMEARRDALQDPRQRAEAERQVQEFKQGLTESQPPVSASVQHNMELIAGFGERLDRLQRLEIDAMVAPGQVPPTTTAQRGTPISGTAAGPAAQ